MYVCDVSSSSSDAADRLHVWVWCQSAVCQHAVRQSADADSAVVYHRRGNADTSDDYATSTTADATLPVKQHSHDTVVVVCSPCHDPQCICQSSYPLPSARQHPSHGDCLEVKSEYYQKCSVLDCVTQCSQSAAHLYEQFL